VSPPFHWQASRGSKLCLVPSFRRWAAVEKVVIGVFFAKAGSAQVSFFRDILSQPLVVIISADSAAFLVDVTLG
jgi:hypothetical protein